MTVTSSHVENKGNYKLVRASDYEVIGDQFCGSLKMIPGVGVLAEGFTSNTGHSHIQFSEVYMILRGTIKLALYTPLEGEVDQMTPGIVSIDEIELREMDSVTIPAGVGHKVIGGSTDNAVLVTCEPAFVPGDEKRCVILEALYSKPAELLAGHCLPARPANLE